MGKIKGAAQLRYKALKYLNEFEVIFGSTMATGSHAVPGGQVPPEASQIDP